MRLFLGFAQEFDVAGAVPRDQAMEIITVGAEAAETVLVKQAFDTTPQAYLVRVFLYPNGPAHFLVPAAPENGHGCPCHTGGHKAHRPQPTTLSFFTHLTDPKDTSSI